MSLKVLDFYADNKLSANNLGKLLMQDALFCILVEINGFPKELATKITKKYRYKEYKLCKDFVKHKAQEYNVLMDFLIYTKSRIKQKWDLSEKEYQDLVAGLELCLIDKYSKFNIFKRALMLGKGIIKGFVNKFNRSKE